MNHDALSSNNREKASDGVSYGTANVLNLNSSASQFSAAFNNIDSSSAASAIGQADTIGRSTSGASNVIGNAAPQGSGNGGATLTGIGRDAVLSTLSPNHPYRSLIQSNPDFMTYNSNGVNPGDFPSPLRDQLGTQVQLGAGGLSFRDPSSGQSFAFVQSDQSQRYMSAFGFTDSSKYNQYVASNEVTQKIYAQDLANGRISGREWELLSNAASSQISPRAVLIQDMLASYDPHPNPNYSAGIDVTRNSVSQVMTSVGLGTGNPQQDFQSFVDGFRQTGRAMVGNGQITMDARGPVEMHRALTAYVNQIAAQSRDPQSGLPLTGDQLMQRIEDQTKANYNTAAQDITSRLTASSNSAVNATPLSVAAAPDPKMTF